MNTTCDKVREEIGAALDGELDAARRREVEAHVGECSSCQAERQAVQETRTALETLDTPPLPADFAARTVDKLLPLLQRPARAPLLGRLLDLLLGSAEPRPESRWQTVGGMLGLTALSSLTGLITSGWAAGYLLHYAGLMSTPYHDRMSSLVGKSLGETSPVDVGVWLLLLIAAMLVIALRLTRVRTLWRLQSLGEAGGVAAATLLATWSMASFGLFAASLSSQFSDVAWQAALDRALLAAVTLVLALALFKKARGVALCAVLFYAALGVSYAMDQSVQAEWEQALNVYRMGWMDFAVTMLPNTPLAAVGSFTLAGMVLAIGLVALRQLGARGRRGWQVPAATCLVVAGVMLAASRTMAESLQYPVRPPARLVAAQDGPARSRNVVLLGQGGETLAYSLSGAFSDAAQRTAREMLADGSVPTAQKRAAAMQLQRGDVLRWDLGQLLADWNEAIQSSWNMVWWPTQAFARAGSQIVPDERVLEFLRQFTDARRWTINNDGTRQWIVTDLARLGDDSAARQAGIKIKPWSSSHWQIDGVPAAADRGSLHGRLLLDGKPASEQLVRIFGGTWYADDSDSFQLQQVRRTLDRECKRSPSAELDLDSVPVTVRTNARGEFEFNHLPPHAYVLAVLLEGSGWQQRGGARPVVVRVDARQRVEVGTIDLYPSAERGR